MIHGTSVPENSILFTDWYQISMGQQYFDRGHSYGREQDMATFEVFIRKFPKDRKAMIMAGLDDIRMLVAKPRLFDAEDIAYLRGMKDLTKAYVDYLEDLQFSGGIYSFPQGAEFYEGEPILRVTAPIIQAQLLETYILNALGFSISVATKAARIVAAAKGKAVVDFSPRRCQGMDAAMKVAKYSFMEGFVATSNVLAGKRYGIPISGTVAHSFITSTTDERDAFVRLLGGGVTTILLDTYDTKRAIHRLMACNDARLKAVRLDSGDLNLLSRYVRKALDKAGRKDVKIVASGDLDEYKIDKLVKANSPIDVFGVGTALGTCSDAPALGITYKLVKFGRQFCMKTSEGKHTMPGIKQVYRSCDQDTIGLEGEALPGQMMLTNVNHLPDIKLVKSQWMELGEKRKPKVIVSPRLLALTDAKIKQIKEHNK